MIISYVYISYIYLLFLRIAFLWTHSAPWLTDNQSTLKSQKQNKPPQTSIKDNKVNLSLINNWWYILYIQSRMNLNLCFQWHSTKDNAFDSELVIWFDRIEVNTSRPVLRTDQPPPSLQTPSPVLPDHPPLISFPPVHSLSGLHPLLLPPALSEQSLDYTNGHDRKDSPSLSSKLHSLRPNQNSRRL